TREIGQQDGEQSIAPTAPRAVPTPGKRSATAVGMPRTTHDLARWFAQRAPQHRSAAAPDHADAELPGAEAQSGAPALADVAPSARPPPASHLAGAGEPPTPAPSVSTSAESTTPSTPAFTATQGSSPALVMPAATMTMPSPPAAHAAAPRAGADGGVSGDV